MFGDTIKPALARHGHTRFDALDSRGRASKLRTNCQPITVSGHVDLAPENASQILLDLAVTSEREQTCAAVGRALRRLDPTIVAPPLSARMRGTGPERKAAAQLAAWLPIPALSEALGHLADHDGTSEVRNAALSALENHQREESLRSLLAAFPSATYNERWSILVVLLDAADPFLLTDRDDPLWLGNAFVAGMPEIFRRHARLVLAERKRKTS
jgi:HEAT repeat protein